MFLGLIFKRFSARATGFEHAAPPGLIDFG
jgi:hypothetical protein